MSLFQTLTKHPLFLKTAAGAAAGGFLSYKAAAAHEHGDGTTSALAKFSVTALGMAAGGFIGANFEGFKQGTVNKFKNIHSEYEPNLSKALGRATKEFTTKRAKAEATALKKGLTGEAYKEAMSAFATAPSREDFGIRASAALETYARPSLLATAGIGLGAVYSTSRGGDPISGATNGAAIALTAGLGYHGFKVYKGSPAPLRAAMGMAAIPTAFAAGMAGNQPEYGMEARAVPNYEGGYDSEPTIIRSGPGRRSQMIGATGDMVFGLQNMRHG